jgi:hypothetical protein
MEGAKLCYRLISTVGNYQAVLGVSVSMGQLLPTGLGLLVLLSAYGGLAQTTTDTRTLSLCDIRSQPKKYLGKVVTVTGEVLRTAHGLGMNNPQCPTVGVALAESKEMEKSRAPQSELFRDGTWKTLLCTDERVFVATVEGRFGTAVTRSIPIYRIVVDRVLRAEFIPQTSPYCINREPPLPPPAIEIPSRPKPDPSH